MKCTCDTCQGEGVIRCWACYGSGEQFIAIQDANLDVDSPLYAVLLTLQKDANRVIAERKRLLEIHPECADSYAKQLRSTLRSINEQADQLITKAQSWKQQPRNAAPA